MDKKNRKELQIQIGDLLMQIKVLQQRLDSTEPGSAEREDIEKSLRFLMEMLTNMSNVSNADKSERTKEMQQYFYLGLGSAAIVGTFHAEKVGIVTSKMFPWCKPKGL